MPLNGLSRFQLEILSHRYRLADMPHLLLILFLSAVVLSACSTTKTTQLDSSVTPTPSVSSSPLALPVVEDEVVLLTPDVTTAVASPLEIEGFAPGTWFFEGSIVGELTTDEGHVLSTFPLHAEGEWMTEEHVRFSGTVEFEVASEARSVELRIKNDNPSGLPENDKVATFTLLLEK